jgi:chromate transporter
MYTHGEAASVRPAITRTAREDEPRPTLWQLSAAFLRYANFTLGGGSATTGVIHHELVERHHWLDEERFMLSFALARVTPGTNVLAFCTGVGWMLQRLPGAALALLAASIPSSLIAVALTILLANASKNRIAAAAIQGAVAAAVAITAKTGWTIVHPHFKPGARWRVIVIGGSAFALHATWGLSAIEVLLLAGVVGAVLPVQR